LYYQLTSLSFLLDRSRLALEEIPATRSKMAQLTWTIYWAQLW